MCRVKSIPAFFYFDLGNVLVTFDHELACRQIGELIGRSVDTVRAVIFGSGLQQRYELGEISQSEFYSRFCLATDCHPEIGALMRAGSDIFALDQSVISIVAQLHAAGHRLGILSNTCESHWQHLSNNQFSTVRAFFELAVLSFEVRCAKPDHAIYDQAAHEVGTAADRIFFVDDRPENVVSARSRRWDAVLFRNADQLVDDLRKRRVFMHRSG